jgi:hypothetical protein
MTEFGIMSIHNNIPRVTTLMKEIKRELQTSQLTTNVNKVKN